MRHAAAAVALKHIVVTTVPLACHYQVHEANDLKLKIQRHSNGTAHEPWKALPSVGDVTYVLLGRGVKSCEVGTPQGHASIRVKSTHLQKVD